MERLFMNCRKGKRKKHVHLRRRSVPGRLDDNSFPYWTLCERTRKDCVLLHHSAEAFEGGSGGQQDQRPFLSRWKQLRLTVACPCVLRYGQQGKKPQFQWNVSCGNRIERPKGLCYHQGMTIVELESHIPSPWKPEGKLRLDDSCCHHPFSQSYRLELL